MNVRVVSKVCFLTLLFLVTSYAQAGVVITKAKLKEKVSPYNEVTSGYADADTSVDFVAGALCDCCSPALEYKWYFGDGDSAVGRTLSHTYGTAGAGKRSAYVVVTCKSASGGCGSSATSPSVTVNAISSIRVDTIGDVSNPTTNGRFSLNSERGFWGTAMPTETGASHLIDWQLYAGSVPLKTLDANYGYLPSLQDADWPNYNSSWGSRTLYVRMDSTSIDSGEDGELRLTGTPSYIGADKSVTVFYDGTGANKDGSDPNWFYYYKDNEGGTDYSYSSSRTTSNCTNGVIEIANNAYTGGTHLTYSYTPPAEGGLLYITGRSSTFDHYQYFMGVVAHERQHGAFDGMTGTDDDNDEIPNTFEIATSLTDPNDEYSASGVYSYDDDECYCGGPVERTGIYGANLSQDWACPGSNW